MHKKSITALIPNYNGVRLLEKHLPKVFDCLRDGDQLIIVDDSSTDKSVEWLQKTYALQSVSELTPLHHYNSSQRTGKLTKQDYALYSANSRVQTRNIEILLVALQDNKRFGQAVNSGVIFAKHQWLFLLNSDVEPQENCLEIGLKNFEDPDVFGIGFLEYASYEKLKPSGKNMLWFEKGLFRHSQATDMKSGTTAWISGGSGLFDTKKWLELGGFDPDFFPAYWEDIDLSFRAQKMGYKTLFNADMVVIHEHETTNSTALGKRNIQRISFKNAELFTKKNGTFGQKLLYYIHKPFNQYSFNRFIERS